MVFKVKCSNNSLFKVSPVFSFLDSGASMDLQILRQEGPTRNDKLIIMYKEAKKSEKDPKKSFENEGVTAKKVIPLITTHPSRFSETSKKPNHWREIFFTGLYIQSFLCVINIA
ncbi:MSP domain protein [Oesophagostomum dentatum]|uniref:MSP domain protein n=1 Tax=Oesophagostomum dentatum TaxID=61180 RepID=A0A0B1TAE6_OESDE|nr:MSP domain protein [Oesophagostomum dentatum]